MTRRSVDLPQPDGPMSDTNSPWAMVRSMAWRATVVSLSPRTNVLPTPCRLTTGLVVDSVMAWRPPGGVVIRG